MSEQLPPILVDYSSFKQHIEAQLEGLKGHDIGDPWQGFSKQPLALTELGKNFLNFKNNPKKTRDKGWDILGTNPSNETERLYVQAKFKVNDKNGLEGVVSDWVALSGVPTGQLTLEPFIPDNQNLDYALVTISDLHSHILPEYRKSMKAAVPFFNKWEQEKRVSIIDGPMIWRMFREKYLKSFGKPQPQTIAFASPYTHLGNVYLGIISASELRRIYNETGDEIFFENVRDFVGRSSVNENIALTIRDHPDQFLQLNNGIVF